MSGLLAKSRLVAYMADGSEHVVVLKPRHIQTIQQHFRDVDPVEMEQTIYTCWLVLNESGVFPGDLESFGQQLDDIGVPEADPKA